MNQRQENQIRSASKFLRTIYAEDISICATVLTAEAELLEGRNAENNINTLIKALDAVRQGSGKMIAALKSMKGE